MTTQNVRLTAVPENALRKAVASRQAESNAVLVASVFCLTNGPFLFLNGLLGLIFAPTGFQTGENLPHRGWNFFFEFNSWHHLTHVLTGLILIAAALRPTWLARGLLAFGFYYVIAATLGFINGNDVFGVIYSDGRDNVVHTLFGLSALGLGLAVSRSRRRRREGLLP